VATAAGAVLILIPSSGWKWSLLVAAGTLAACYFALATKTHAEYRRVLLHLRRTKAAGAGDVYTETLLGLRFEAPNDLPLQALNTPTATPIDEMIRQSEERASWRWALTHPSGARGRGM
jgi:hypothetical protein